MKNRTLWWSGFGSLMIGSWIFGCTAGPGDSGEETPGDGDGDGDLCLSDCGDGDIDPGDGDIGAPPGENCGNGAVDRMLEACDDGNNEDGDGCWGNCLGVEPGYICREGGQTCVPIARCGDGAVIFPEQCDDSNTEPGDGCSATCKVEIGFKCPVDDANVSTCVPTVCGDGVVEGAETCDDGNNVPFDGCGSDCVQEPSCADDGCTSECGDGIVLDEDCDDGNTTEGDGCSSVCRVEEGYTCDATTECEVDASGNCVLAVPAIFRDFNAGDLGDFEPGSTECASDTDASTGIVQSTLGPDGVPVDADDTCAFLDVNEWFTDTHPAIIPGEIILYDNGSGGFVNRWAENGDRWPLKPVTQNLRWCGQAADNCSMCTLAANEQCWTSDWPEGCCSACSCGGSMTQDFIDGDPFFFPLDGHPDALPGIRYPAQTSPAYGWDWRYEKDFPFIGVENLHNFHFTTEVHYWFVYDNSANARFEFLGDDDVWVFINGQQVVDLGGLHPPLEDAYALSFANGDALGLVDGNVYDIAVFHAERKTTGSSFKLTLSGFSTARSDCTAVCGDGVIGFGEECDDGAENGEGYNACGADCRLGDFCGDGIKQDNEACDDADPNAPAGCNGCNVIVVR